jgi:hypothetical protein
MFIAPDACVCMGHVLSQLVPDALVNVRDPGQETMGNRHQCLQGPAVEPVELKQMGGAELMGSRVLTTVCFWSVGLLCFDC